MFGDDEREDQADEETLPDTPLHAYKDDREEDVEGDVEKLKSSDPDEAQRDEISDDSETSDFPNPEKH
jgi:hypothetical protein